MASTVLLLVTPNDTTSTTEFRPVTLGNHRNCVSLYIESKIAELPTEPETALKTGRLMKELDINLCYQLGYNNVEISPCVHATVS